MTPRVLVLAHDASRTGAPMLATSFLEWLVRNHGVQVNTLVLRDGPMRHRLSALGPVTALNADDRRVAGELCEIALGELGARSLADRLANARMKRLLGTAAHNADVIYANSAASLRLLDALGDDRPPALAHIHELEVGIQKALPTIERLRQLAMPESVVAVADRVEETLVGQFGVDATRVVVRHGFIDVAKWSRVVADGRAAAKMALGLPADCLVIGGSGGSAWRKGLDLFVQLAQHTRDHPDLFLVWLGAKPGDLETERAADDARRAGVADRLRLLPPTSDPRPIYSAFDVLALTSREDPFPLVALEVGSLGTPVVAFDSGGIGELLGVDGDGRGQIVPPVDVAAMARAMELRYDRGRRDAEGCALSEHIARHHDIHHLAPVLTDDLLSLI